MVPQRLLGRLVSNSVKRWQCMNLYRYILRLWMLAAVICVGAALAGCATTSTGPTVKRLTQRQYPPTQTVDVLTTLPQKNYARIAQLQANDPTGSATRSQLIAELVNSAQQLGANAIVIEQIQQSSGSELSFNPSGGQMQSAGGGQPMSVRALAIRYAH